MSQIFTDAAAWEKPPTEYTDITEPTAENILPQILLCTDANFRGCTCLRSALPLARARSAPTNRSLVGAAETAAPPDSGKSRVSPGNYIAKINGVHREVMCWHLLSTTHAGCNTRELIPLWHLLGRLPLASRLAVAHGEVHR